MTEDTSAVLRLSGQRWRTALALTGIMLLVYFGFILLIAFDKPFLAHPLGRGLTLGIALGVLVILSAWLLTWVYVWWANTRYDPALRKIQEAVRKP